VVGTPPPIHFYTDFQNAVLKCAVAGTFLLECHVIRILFFQAQNKKFLRYIQVYYISFSALGPQKILVCFDRAHKTSKAGLELVPPTNADEILFPQILCYTRLRDRTGGNWRHYGQLWL